MVEEEEEEEMEEEEMEEEEEEMKAYPLLFIQSTGSSRNILGFLLNIFRLLLPSLATSTSGLCFEKVVTSHREERERESRLRKNTIFHFIYIF